MNKKGIELSINFIVVLILAIVSFGIGLKVLSGIFFTANEYEARINEQTENEIVELLMDGERVAVPINKKEVRKGESVVLGLGIHNARSKPQTDFKVKVNFSGMVDEDRKLQHTGDASIRNYIHDNWMHAGDREYKLKHNENEIVPIQFVPDHDVKSGTSTEKGTYIFNVYVSYKDNGNWKLYDNVEKIYLEVS